MTTVIWTQTALDNYLSIIDYLFEHWTNKQIDKFEQNVEQVVCRIQHHNQIGKLSKILNYRKIIINKHISLIYALENNSIYLIAFLHNKSNHAF
ncbi:MAG: type II toxin-antitoxin system RelE/ParE family toxin [Chitinophagales bacterium]|nr:type II toxin-antitoxin system RelE/ParE family toxin [Chitinophagales bacterium]